MDSLPWQLVDSSCWIDADAGKIVRAMFRLPMQWTSTTLVFRELEPHLQRVLKQLNIQISNLTENDVTRMGEMVKISSALSMPDLSSLIVAENLKIPLITGDRTLRVRAGDQGLEVHGTLWILDQLVTRKILAKDRAIRSVELILASGGRLPLDEVEKRKRGGWG